VPCAVELASDAGKTEQGCSVMWSHALRTHVVEKPCDKCKTATTKQADLLAGVKSTLKALREVVDAKVARTLESPSDSDSEDGKAKEETIEGEVEGVKEPRKAGDEETTTTPFEVKFDPKHHPLKLVQQLELYNKDKST